MAGPYFNFVRFVVDGGPTLALSLESDFVLSAGVQPNINTAVVPWEQYDLLQNNPDRTGRLEFYFNRSSLTPDYTIQKISIIRVEALEAGMTVKSGGQRRFIKYRLYLADRRHKFVSPRGGNLRVGRVNFDGENRNFTNDQLID